MEEGDRCQLCGTAPWEWEENRFAYTPMERHCQGCYLKSIASDNEQTIPGTTIELVPTSRQLTAKMAMKHERRRRQQLADRAESAR